MTKQSRYEEALSYFEKLQELDSDSPIYSAYKAKTLINLDKAKSALEEIESILQHYDNHSFSLTVKGKLLESLGRSEKAENYFQKARELVSNGSYGKNVGGFEKEFINSTLGINSEYSYNAYKFNTVPDETVIDAVSVLKYYDAARQENFQEIRRLAFEEQQPINAKDKLGETFLHKLVKSDSVMEFLTLKNLLKIENLRINLNIADEDGKTLLHYVIERGDSGLIKFLLAKGANPNIEDKEGKTALYYAVENKDLYNFELLKSKEHLINLELPSNKEAVTIANSLEQEEEEELLRQDSAASSSMVTYNNMSYARHIELFKQGKYNKVLKKLNQISKIDDNLELFLLKAECYYAQGQFEAARLITEYILDENSENSHLYETILLKARALTRLHEYEQAEECFKELNKQENEIGFDLNKHIKSSYIKCLYYAGNKELALSSLDKLPEEAWDIELLNIRGNLAKEEGNNETAISYYDKALSCRGWENHPITLTNKALALLSSGKEQEAFNYLKNAEEIIALGYNDNMLRQVDLEVINNTIQDNLQKLGKELRNASENIEEASGVLSSETTPESNTALPSSSQTTKELKTQIFNRLSYLDIKLHQLEKSYDKAVSHEELEWYTRNFVNWRDFEEELDKKASKEEVSYAIAYNEEWKKVQDEINTIKQDDSLNQYYYTFLNVFSSHLRAAQVLGTNQIKYKQLGLSKIEKIIPLPMVKEIASLLGITIDKAVEYYDKRKVDHLIELSNKIDTVEVSKILARKVTLTKHDTILNYSPQKEQANKIFEKIMKSSKAGKLEKACDTEIKKLAYKDASKIIGSCYTGKLNENEDMISQLINFVSPENFDYNQVGGRDEAPLDMSAQIRDVIEMSTEGANKCNVMAINHIQYDNPKIDAAMKNGDVEGLRKAIGNYNFSNLLGSTSHEARVSELEELCRLNNIQPKAVEEFIEGISELKIPEIKNNEHNHIDNFFTAHNYGNHSNQVVEEDLSLIGIEVSEEGEFQ